MLNFCLDRIYSFDIYLFFFVVLLSFIYLSICMGFMSTLKKLWIIRSGTSAGNFDGPSEYDPITNSFVHHYKSHKKPSKVQNEKEPITKKKPLRILILWWLLICIVALLGLILCFDKTFVWGWLWIFLFWILLIVLILFFLKFVRWIYMFLLFLLFTLFVFIFPYMLGHNQQSTSPSVITTTSTQEKITWKGPCFVPWCTRAPSNFSQNISTYIWTKKEIPNYCCLTITRETNGAILAVVVDETPLFNLYWADYVNKYFNK